MKLFVKRTFLRKVVLYCTDADLTAVHPGVSGKAKTTLAKLQYWVVED
jgi:hypothetical protein